MNPAIAYVGNYTYDINDLVNNAKKRYLMAIQVEKPVIDKELTEIGWRQFDMLGRYLERNIGDAVIDGDRTAVLESDSVPGRSWRVEESTVNNINNFVVKGGTIDKPAILVVKGYPLLLFNDIEYDQQGNSGLLEDDNYTETTIPSLSPPIAGTRTDTVYVDTYLAEVSSEPGSEYQDTSIKDITLGIQSANRLRIVQDILLAEATTSIPVDGVDANGIYHRYYKLAEISRTAGVNAIVAADINDTRNYVNTLENLSNGKGELNVFNGTIQNDLTVHGTLTIINETETNQEKLVIETNDPGVVALVVNKTNTGDAVQINKEDAGKALQIIKNDDDDAVYIDKQSGTGYALNILHGSVVIDNGGDLFWSPDIEGVNSIRTHVDNQLALSEPTGFPNRLDTTISFNNSLLQFTISATGTNFNFFINNRRYTRVSDSVNITDTEGLWFIYYNNNGIITASQSSWDVLTELPIAMIYWDAASNIAIIFGEERHGTIMDGQTHEYLHSTMGTRYSKGLALSGTISGLGNLDADAEISLTGGIIFDEDLKHQIIDGTGSYFEQILSSVARIPVYYRSSGNWRKRAADNFPVFSGVSSGRIGWNNPAVWTVDEVQNGYFVPMWLFATNNISEPIIAVLGQSQHATLLDAENNATFQSLQFGTFPATEFKVIYRLIYETQNSFTNTPKARLVDIQDERAVSNVSGGTFVATDHGSLSGLTEQDHPASAIYVNVSSFDGSLSALDDDVQKALDTLDNIWVKTGATDLYRVSGNVGIGTNTFGGYRFKVEGSAHITGGTLLSSTLDVGGVTHFNNATIHTPQTADRVAIFNVSKQLVSTLSVTPAELEAYVADFPESVEDISAAMITGGTQSGINVTYNDGPGSGGGGTIDFNVDDFTITLSGDVSGSGNVINNSNVNISVAVADDSHSHSNSTLTSLAWGKLTGVPSPVITLSGDVTGSGTMTNLGSVTITATVGDDTHSHSNSTLTSLDWSKLLNVPDPVITLSGDVTGSGTMTNLGSTTISATVANDSHEHQRLQSTSHYGTYYIENYWTGTYWRIQSNHTSGCSVAHADYANSAGNADTVDGYHIGSRTNWNNLNSIGAVVGQLAWKNYSNNHTIFDASAGTSPDGTTVNNTNSSIAWASNYPTLMGWNGISTYGVRVDSARIADSAAYATSSGYATSAGNSDTCDGLHVHAGINNEANRIVRTDASGYIYAGWINTISGDASTVLPTRIYASYDGFIRYYTPANFVSVMNLSYANHNHDGVYNYYTHPSYTPRSIDTSGATVIDAFSCDGLGHVTNLTTRTLSINDLGGPYNNYIHPTYDNRQINTSGDEVIDLLYSNTSGHVTYASKRSLGLGSLATADPSSLSVSLTPSASTTYDLGSDSDRWFRVYCSYLISSIKIEASNFGAVDAVSGASQSGYGVKGSSGSNSGVYGSSGSGYGVQGFSSLDHGVYGSTGGGTGKYAVYAGTGGFGSFTGGHDVLIKKGQQIERGMIVVTTGYTLKDKDNLELTLPEIAIADIPNCKSVFGVFDSIIKDKITEFKLSDDDEVGKAYGIGDGQLLVTDYNGELEDGDLVTTSDIPGYGMKQDDDLYRNYTVAKVTENIDWDSITDTIEYNGQQYKKTMVAVTYHCS